jgi:hypothetical protein
LARLGLAAVVVATLVGAACSATSNDREGVVGVASPRPSTTPRTSPSSAHPGLDACLRAVAIADDLVTTAERMVQRARATEHLPSAGPLG